MKLFSSCDAVSGGEAAEWLGKARGTLTVNTASSKDAMCEDGPRPVIFTGPGLGKKKNPATISTSSGALLTQ